MNATADRILRRVRAMTGHGSRRAFTPSDFLDFGGRAAVDQALSRLTKAGTLRRIGRGLYDIPVVNPLLKTVAAPDVAAVVDAVAHRDGVTIVRDGLAAANGFGLTNAVPARHDFLTDGPSRTITVGGRVVRLKHAGPALMALKHRPAGDVVRALHWLGRDIATGDKVVGTLRRKLPDAAKKDLARARPTLSGWTAQVADRVLASA